MGSQERRCDLAWELKQIETKKETLTAPVTSGGKEPGLRTDWIETNVHKCPTPIAL